MNAGPPSPLQGVFVTSCRAADVPPGDAWMTPAERDVSAALTVPKRAADWRLGRWTAKAAVADALAAHSGTPLGPELVEILPEPGGRPSARVSRPGAPAVALSLSHCRDRGFAAARVGPELGCDVEVAEPRSDDFLRDYLTGDELLLVAKGEQGWEARANAVWSLKESALKALGHGLRADTRSVRVHRLGEPEHEGAWAPCGVEGAGLERPRSFWRLADGLVWTLVCPSPPGHVR